MLCVCTVAAFGIGVSSAGATPQPPKTYFVPAPVPPGDEFAQILQESTGLSLAEIDAIFESDVFDDAAFERVFQGFAEAEMRSDPFIYDLVAGFLVFATATELNDIAVHQYGLDNQLGSPPMTWFVQDPVGPNSQFEMLIQELLGVSIADLESIFADSNTDKLFDGGNPLDVMFSSLNRLAELSPAIPDDAFADLEAQFADISVEFEALFAAIAAQPTAEGSNASAAKPSGATPAKAVAGKPSFTG